MLNIWVESNQDGMFEKSSKIQTLSKELIFISEGLILIKNRFPTFSDPNSQPFVRYEGPKWTKMTKSRFWRGQMTTLSKDSTMGYFMIIDQHGFLHRFPTFPRSQVEKVIFRPFLRGLDKGHFFI